LNLQDFNSLHKWSTENLAEFWSYAWDESQIKGIKGKIFYKESSNFIDAQFFPNSYLNVVENLLTNNLEDETAIIALSETADKVEITWQQLRIQVARTANAMIDLGIRPHDRVVAWAPNVPDTLIFSLAALSIGAVVSTASPDFAPTAVLDRFSQIEPKLLLACSNYQYNGKLFNCEKSLAEIVSKLPTLRKVVITGTSFNNYQSLSDWVAPYHENNLDFIKFAFNHPGFILFSSGTTGKPKCIIHSAAGILLKLRAEQLFNFDLGKNDKVFFYTTTGWMMWNWLLYILASQATIVLYDGSPIFPLADNLIEIAASEKCTHLGVSAKYIDLLKKSGISSEKYDLSNLKSIISTGSVLSPESFEYVYNEISLNIHLASISGGTDICGCFVSAVPTLPVYSGEIQGACLGLAVDVFDEDGRSLPPGQKGELVCTKPFPSMPIGFWNDKDNLIYKNAYFSKFAGIWAHRDFASKTKNGGFLIHGRSDATLNSKGVRIGTAEIYRVVEQIDEIVESLAVAKEIEADSKIVLFVVVKSGAPFTQELKSQINSLLRSKASPRHVPDLILQAPELPKTKSNKLVEIAVADLINGRAVRNMDALINPEALAWFSTLDLSAAFQE
jgi:acetoacetyl-CoA synthetase